MIGDELGELFHLTTATGASGLRAPNRVARCAAPFHWRVRFRTEPVAMLSTGRGRERVA